MKFRHKLERTLSLRFYSDKQKKSRNHGNNWNHTLSGNAMINDHCSKHTIDSEFNTESLSYGNKTETPSMLFNDGNKIHDTHCHLKTDTKNSQGFSSGFPDIDDKNNLLHYGTQSDSLHLKSLHLNHARTEKRRKKDESVFKRNFSKTKKKIGFVKRISNSKSSSKKSNIVLPANLKSHIFASLADDTCIDIKKGSAKHLSCQGIAIKSKGDVKQCAGGCKEDKGDLRRVEKISELKLRLENNECEDSKLHVPNTESRDAEGSHSESRSCKFSKDLSPTCADVYGVDEVDNVSFDKISIEKGTVDAISSNIIGVTKYKGKQVSSETSIISETGSLLCNNSDDVMIIDNDITEVNNAQDNSNEDSKRLPENVSKVDKQCRVNSDKYKDLSRICSFRMASSQSQHTKSKGHDSFENPWVLQNSSQNISGTSSNHTNVEVESSLGFEVNYIDAEDISASERKLIRSSSTDSVDSFGSSYHSVNSVKDIYFSDSEAEHNIGNISDDSTEYAPCLTGFKDDHNSSGKVSNLEMESFTDMEKSSKCASKVNKGYKRPSSMGHFSEETSLYSKHASDSDSDEKQMIPYALAERFSGNVTNRKKKKKLHSRSVDEKLDKTVQDSPERKSGNKKTNLIKSLSLGLTTENESKTVEKVKHFRRSLDSSLVQRKILNELQSAEKREFVSTDSNEFLSPVPESHSKPSQIEKTEFEDSGKNLDPTWFFTLPNPKKLRAQQQNLKKKLSRLGSVSKILSDKATSFSSLRLGASFKLRKELEKSKELVSSSATSFSDLMSKKASSFSTLIRRRTNSNTAVESPFKQYAKKVKKVKDENPSELVYEKVRIRIPTKRPVTALEQTARTKRLKVNLRLAKNACKSESDKYDIDSKSRSSSSVGRPWNSTSISPLKSPTLLDEMMKSVDTARVRQQCSVTNDDLDVSDCGESSSGSSLFLFQKQYSLDSDTNLAKDSSLLAVCRTCGRIQSGSDRSSSESLLKRNSGSYRFSLSLCDLSSTCQCLKRSRSYKDRFSVILPVTHETGTNQNTKRKSWVIMSDSNQSVPNEIKGGNICGKGKVWLTKCQRPSSMFDLRHNLNETKEEKVEFEMGDGISNDSIDAADVLPGTLFRQKPLLDLSGENLDETVDSQDDILNDTDDGYAKKSQSCGDLLESGRYDDIISRSNSVKIEIRNENDEETESFHSCSESAETDNVFETGNSEKQKSHSCSNLLEANEVNLGDTLKLEEQRKKELRKVKVKSMSSSHDALSILVAMETINIDEVDGILGKGFGNNKNSENHENGQSIVNNILELTQNGLDIENNVKTSQGKTIDTESESKTNTSKTIPDDENKENDICERCKCLRNDLGDSKLALNPRLNPLIDETDRKIVSKPPLPRKKGHAKVLSLCDISNQENDNYKEFRRQKVLSMADLHEGRKNFCLCKFDSENDHEKKKSDNSKTVIEKPKSGRSLTPKSSSLRKPVRKFLFDDHQIKSYIKTVSKFDRQKSISSDNILSGSIESPRPNSSDNLHSACSLNRLSQDSWSDEVFNRISFPFVPELSPYAEFFESTPVKGFSRLSGSRITSPGLFPELPELPSSTEECVDKYDVCLGYLLHSVQCDNKMICVYSLQRNKQLMESVITPLNTSPHTPHRKSHEHGSANRTKAQHRTKLDEFPNPATPITNVPSDRLARAGIVLRTVLLARAPHMIRDRKFHLRTYRRCMVGTEMVDWLLQQSTLVHSRNQAVGMWQALVEEGVVVHVCHEHQFKDKYLFYRFHEDDEGVSTVPSSATKRECEEDLPDVFLMLAHIGPDAMMRMILRKPPHERTSEDLEIIYEELLHIKALSHLSTMVKRELASVLLFESHAKSGTVLFNQGDEGKSWYIILKGSVNVVIYGKGVVCTLHEGDDFGKLALVNDAPRAATIVLRDDNCHFLRVDKDDFNRILRDVEANTVRLKEHGQDVLVLEKIPSNTHTADGSVHAHYKYSVMAGTPEKMLEHLLDSRLDNKNETEIDGFLEDFLLTHVIFMPCNHLCPVLLSHYHSSTADTTEQEGFEFMLNHKRCVLHFVQEWANIVGVAFKEDHTINAFLEELTSCVQDDLEDYPTLKDDMVTMETILNTQSGSPSSKQKKRNSGTFTFSRKHSKECYQDIPKKRKPICPSDETIFKVYCADHTYSTLKLPMDTKVEQLLLSTKEKLGLGDDLILCEVKSTGERLIFKENDLCVTTGLSINGELFVTPKEHLDALTPLPEQEGPSDGSFSVIEMYSSREMAYHMTQYDWELFTCLQEYELIYQVFGRYKFGKITANLDLFLRRFNEIQFWVVTEMVMTHNLSKRVSLLRKFIKIAAHCKEFKNLNSFFAIVMGLSNIAVSRLSQTWEKLPSKFKKMFADFETLMDPSRNHRVYRLSVAKMLPPIIPFMPLLMKDMTFTHEGNKTYFDGLVNFEKMHMIAQTLKTVRFCRSARLEIEAPGTLKSSDTSDYIRSLKVIDNQRLLTQLSHKLEPRKT